VLAYDMVFVPHQPLTAALVGLSRALPRSVPSALAVALLSRVLTGEVVEKLILAGTFAGAAFGAARLVPAERPAARVAAGVLYAWNPMLYERLLMGQWALLLGYAALPWVAWAALDLRRGDRRAFPWLVLAMAATVLASPYSGILGAAVAMAVALAPPWRQDARYRQGVGRAAGPARMAGLVVAAVVVVNLPWVIPATLHPPVAESPNLAAALFRARSDSPLGTVGSLLSLGGLWRTDLAPPGRTTVAWVPAFAIIAALVAVGWRRIRGRWPPGAVAGLLGLAAAGLFLAAAPSVPGLAGLSRWLARSLPGGGILRDSQKFVIPLALAGAVGFGLGVDAVLSRLPTGRSVARAAAVALPMLPVALAPTLAWGLGGRLFTAQYPPSWSRAEAVMAADRTRGAVLVLPWHAYLPFGWNGGRAVHQPALDFFSRPVVASSELEVGAYRLPPEDPWSRLAQSAVTGPGPLSPALDRLGVRYVLLFREADWRTDLGLVRGLVPVLDTADLTLYRAPPPGGVPAFRTAPAGPVVAGDVLALLTVLAAAAAAARPHRRSRPGR
jgi:hypothetical protein